jgi:hypothetical protein
MAAKTTVSVPLKLGVLSGRIFAITTGGDIKPARLAKTFLFYVRRSGKSVEAIEEDQNSAGSAWLTEEAKALEAFNQAWTTMLKQFNEAETVELQRRILGSESSSIDVRWGGLELKRSSGAYEVTTASSGNLSKSSALKV